MQIFRQLKPSFALQETFTERRKKVPDFNIRSRAYVDRIDHLVADETQDFSFFLDFDSATGNDQEVKVD